MIWERRRQKREVLDGFAFIQIDGDDGGRILNLSEEGLAFEPFSPILQEDPIHFWLSFDLQNRIPGTGKLTWTDATAKVGGLKFLDLSQRARDLIRVQLNGAISEGNGSHEAEPVQVRTDSNPANQDTDCASVAAPVARKWPLTSTLLSSDAEREESTPGAALTATPFAASELVPLKYHLAATRRRFVLGFLLGLFVAAVVAVPIFEFSLRRAPSAVPTPSVAFSSVAPAVSGAGNSSSQLSPTVQAAAKSTSAQPASQPLPQSVAQSSAEQATAPSSPKRSRKLPTTPGQLWAAAQTGNIDASVALADLYIRGEGVPRNCTQARVLLLVASEKGSAAARKKLEDLDKSDCPAQ